MITSQRICVSFGKNNSLTTVVVAVSSDVLELIVPPKGICQQVLPFGQLQPCVNFPYDNSHPVILQQDVNLIFLPLWDTFVHSNSFPVVL